MKQAIGRYILVRSITKEEAINLASELFRAEGSKLRAEADKLWVEGVKLWAEADKLWVEGVKLWAEGSKLRAEADKLWVEGVKLRAEADSFWAEGSKLWAEGSKLRAEADKLWVEGVKLWAELAIQYCAFIPDYRAMNFIAADREGGVYCFVWNRKEIWFYDGENCPKPNTVEVVWKEEKPQ